ncbi:MAG TPA: hypothetical protein VE992_04755, partial [Solirubrobacteraceae bacterium]|nr:hypothetical protein [Solirubrobacteraceae bacterium]
MSEAPTLEAALAGDRSSPPGPRARSAGDGPSPDGPSAYCAGELAALKAALRSARGTALVQTLEQEQPLAPTRP